MTNEAATTERQAAFRALIASIAAKENYPLGIAGGIVGGLLGAIAWATVSATTHYQIGYLAVGIGWLVGYGVRTLGNGMTKPFGYIGAVLSLGGCLGGHFGSLIADAAEDLHRPFLDVLMNVDPSKIPLLMREGFDIMDVLFYGMAIYFGYRYSIRKPTKEELAKLPA